MSGVCGVIATDGRSVHASQLAACLNVLGAFGADSASWQGPVGRLSVALGVRASIPRSRTAAAGTQPLVSADGRIVLVADVVLDCRADLVAALGQRSATRSDEALVLAAYERWGEACLERLSGEFAFAIADERRGGVLLARDQLGCRPLVLHERGGAICFATTALALGDLPGVGHVLDRERVAEWLAFVIGSEATFVRGAVHLPQGHALWVDGRGTRRWRYWTLDPGRIVDLGSPDAHARALRSALDDAVARRLSDGVETGIMLSGGLDSTSVAATAARLRAPADVRTYTSVPPEGWTGPTAPIFDADERALVEDLARWHPNLRPTFVDHHEGSLLARHDAAFRAGSPPPRNPCNALWLDSINDRAVRDGVGTLLTGARGNAFFSADDPRWLVDLLHRGRLIAVRREVAAMAAAWGCSQATVARTMLLREHVPAAILRRRGAAAGRENPYRDLALRSAGRNAEAVVRAHWTGLDLERRSASRERALESILARGMGNSEVLAVGQALTGVRMADPTGDIRLLELCASQPSWVRRRNGRTRAVCRDAMADRLPPSIAERTRRGAQLPDWLDRMTAGRDELAAELAAARDSETCRTLLDLDRLDGALRAWPDREQHAAAALEINRTYRFAMFRGLLVARYIRFFEEHARERAARPIETAA